MIYLLLEANVGVIFLIIYDKSSWQWRMQSEILNIFSALLIPLFFIFWIHCLLVQFSTSTHIPYMCNISATQSIYVTYYKERGTSHRCRFLTTCFKPFMRGKVAYSSTALCHATLERSTSWPSQDMEVPLHNIIHNGCFTLSQCVINLLLRISDP